MVAELLRLPFRLKDNQKKKHLNLLKGRRGVTNATNVSSYGALLRVQIILCRDFSLKEISLIK